MSVRTVPSSKVVIQKDVFKSLAEHFDKYVMEQVSLTQAAAETPQPQNKMDCYRAEMERRLKLRPQTQQQKFASLLKPMTGLKSYVSVEDFLKKLNSDVMGMVRPTIEPQKVDEVVLSDKDKLIRKTEIHLWKNRAKRRQAWGQSRKVTEPCEVSSYGNWMQEQMGKPQNKGIRRLMGQQLTQHCRNSETENTKEEEPKDDCLIEQHKTQHQEHKKVVKRVKDSCKEQYNQFTKLSTMLSGRLRKLLKSNTDLGRGMRNTTKTSETVALSRFTIAEPDAPNRAKKKPMRAKTAQPFRSKEKEWKDSVSKRLKGIMDRC